MTEPTTPGPVLPIGTAKHRALEVWADGDDPDQHPDLGLIKDLEATFTATRKAAVWTGAGGPVSLAFTSVVGRYDDAGVLRLVLKDKTLSVAEGVRLYANHPDLQPNDWHWKVTWKGAVFGSGDFQLEPGEDFDLSTVILGSSVPDAPRSFDDLLQAAADLRQAIIDGGAGPGGAVTPDATDTVKGKIQLAGDLGGTADAPTVPGLADKAPTGHNHDGTYAHVLGPDDNYVTDAEKAKLANLATVATTGAYTDLTGTPTIPDTETIQDVVGAMVAAAGGTYNDAVGTITLPSGAGGSGVTADDTPAAPAEEQSASYLVSSAVSWPAGLVWSTDPDGGAAPTITGTALVALFTLGGVTRAIMGATFPPPPLPPDTTAPGAGTLSSSAITGSSFTLTITGATDAGGLHAQPFRFSTDNGLAFSAWQTLEHYMATGLDASTAYTCTHEVRDAALNVTAGTPITVTTTTPDPGNEAPAWTATFTMGTPTSTSITATASALATDDTAVTGYQVSYNGGTDWAPITPAGSVFTLTGAAETTYATTQLRAVDNDGAHSAALSVPSYTLAAEAPAVTATYRGRIDGATGTGFAIGDAPTGGDTRSVIVAYVALYNGTAPTAMTIGGVSATRDAYYDGYAPWQTQQPVAMFHAAVPTGTTATVTATGGGGEAPKMYVWTTDAEVGLIDAKVSSGSGSGSPESITLATSAGGIVVGGVAGQFSASMSGWSANLVTDQYVTNYAAAHGTTAGTNMTVAWSGYRNRMVAAAYGAV